MKKFIKELKRRNVIKATIAYLVVAWILLQVFTILLPIVNAPDWVLKISTLIMAIGLPVWIVISWIYDITPKGIEVTAKDPEKQIINEITNKRLNIFIIAGLVIAVIVLAIRPSIFSSETENTIAILPFDNMISDEENEWISEGVTSGIYTYLSKIKNLDVISEIAVKDAFKDTVNSNIEIAKELGVTYILTGKMQQLGNDVIITAHLTNVNSKRDEWIESYDEYNKRFPKK